MCFGLRVGGLPADPLFITRRGTPLSRDAPERRIAKYTTIAAKTCPALLEKQVSPHILRHSAVMRLLSAGVDTSVIALWMGHEGTATTQVYIHADLALKQRAIARTPSTLPPAATSQPTTSWRSSTACDYAERCGRQRGPPPASAAWSA
jgi:integrase/recombinase XerD